VLRKLQNILEEIKVGLVEVVGLGGLVEIRNQWATATDRELGDGKRVAGTKHVLRVQVGLAAVLGSVLVVEATIVLDDGEVLADNLRQVALLKLGKIGVAGILLQIANEGQLAAALGVCLVVKTVEGLQAGGGDQRIAVVCSGYECFG